LRKRVRNPLKRKDLNGKKAEMEKAQGENVGVGEWLTRERIAWENQLVKCYSGNGENWGVDGNGGGLTVRAAETLENNCHRKKV
jgi:hypothetical protein